MQIIENFKILLSTDIDWAAGPGWLLALVVAWVVMIVVASKE
jgi:hypothetical protein